MRRIGLVALVLSVGLVLAGAAPTAAQLLPGTEVATPVHDTYAATGPWTVEVDAVTYASGQTGVVYRPVPTEGSATDGPFPVIVWGNGSGATPEGEYPGLLRAFASWGYVVTATDHEEVGTGEPLLESLDHLRTLAADPAWPLAGRVDLDRIGAVGHSQGAGGALNATRDSGGVIDTVVPFALPRRVFVGAGDEYQPEDLTVPVFFLGGALDVVIAPPDVVRGFYDDVPGAAAMGVVTLAEHSRPFQGDGGPFRGYLVAWFEYVLRGDAVAAGAFTGGDPELLRHPDFQDQAVKNLTAPGQAEPTSSDPTPPAPGAGDPSSPPVTAAPSPTPAGSPAGSPVGSGALPATGGRTLPLLGVGLVVTALLLRNRLGR